MHLEIDTSSSVPLYEQLVEQVALSVAAGALTPGDPLPSVRGLAADLRVNPNTAARALREMRLLGLSRARRGSGYEVAASAKRVAERISRTVLEREMARVIRIVRDLGLDREALDRALDEQWKESEGVGRSGAVGQSLRA